MGWGSVVLGILVIFLGANYPGQGEVPFLLVVLGIVIGLVGAIVGMMTARIVFPKQITKTHVWLNGVCPEFLSQYPTWHGGN